jgi:hypothetical protein
MRPHSTHLIGNSFNYGLRAPPHEVCPSSFHIIQECGLHTPSTHPHIPHAFLPLKLTLSSFELTLYLGKSGKSSREVETSSIEARICFGSMRGPPLSQYASPLMPLHPSTHLTYQFRPYPKSSRHPSIELSLAWILTLVKDPRGSLLVSQAIKETSHSLIIHHSSQYCYATKFSPSPSLSLSHIVILLHWFWFLKSLKQLCCYNLFPLDNKEIALEELGVLDFVYMLHLYTR